MSDDFLRRWSRRKQAAKAERESPSAAAIPVPAGIQSPGPRPADAIAPAEAPPAPLPAVESLTPESDFTPFMKPEVDAGLRQKALRTLFRDPRFNVMDGLDVYIDDYSKPDPLPDGWLEKMNQVARLGDYKPPEAAEAQPEPAEAAPEAAAADESAAVPATTPEAETSGSPDASNTSVGQVPDSQSGNHRGI